MDYLQIESAINNGELTVPQIGQAILSIINTMGTHDAKIAKLEKTTAQTGRTVRDMEEEYPLLPPEADDVQRAVRHKGVEVLGGKKSPAYEDKELRNKVFRDIYNEVKRQYGLLTEKGTYLTYKKLKRKHFKGALATIDEYVLPVYLEEEVTEANELAE